MKKYLIMFLSIILIFSFPCNVYASDETCEHSYHIIAFDDSGSVTIKCSKCSDLYTDNFINHLTKPDDNSNYDIIFDLNKDGIINARDYSFLIHNFSDNLDYCNLLDVYNSKQFLYKEQFFYIYLTILIIVSVFCICLTIRRCSR